MPHRIYSAKHTFYVGTKGVVKNFSSQPISAKTDAIHKYNEGKKVIPVYSNGKN